MTGEKSPHPERIIEDILILSKSFMFLISMMIFLQTFVFNSHFFPLSCTSLSRLTSEMEKHVSSLHQVRSLESENARLRLLLAGSPQKPMSRGASRRNTSFEKSDQESLNNTFASFVGISSDDESLLRSPEVTVIHHSPVRPATPTQSAVRLLAQSPQSRRSPLASPHTQASIAHTPSPLRQSSSALSPHTPLPVDGSPHTRSLTTDSPLSQSPHARSFVTGSSHPPSPLSQTHSPHQHSPAVQSPAHTHTSPSRLNGLTPQSAARRSLLQSPAGAGGDSSNAVSPLKNQTLPGSPGHSLSERLETLHLHYVEKVRKWKEREGGRERER